MLGAFFQALSLLGREERKPSESRRQSPIYFLSWRAPLCTPSSEAPVVTFQLRFQDLPFPSPNLKWHKGRWIMQEAGETGAPCKDFCHPAHSASDCGGLPTPGMALAFANGECNLQSAWAGSGGIADWPGPPSSLAGVFHAPWLDDMTWDPGSLVPGGWLSPQPPGIQRHAGSPEFWPCHITGGLGGCWELNLLSLCLPVPAWYYWFGLSTFYTSYGLFLCPWN